MTNRLAALFAFTCLSMPLPAIAAPKVVTSILPIHSLAAAVMQGVGEPQLIIDGTGSPHTYALKPSQAEMLEQADIVVWLSHELEAFLEKPLETLAAKAVSVELLDADGVAKLALREGGAFDEHDHGEHAEGENAGKEETHADHDHGHGEFDAHAWLDPQNAQKFTLAIAAALAASDPQNAQAYNDNAKSANAKLDALITEVSQTLSPVKGKGFIVFHDAYQYFENRFGVTAAGSITVSPEVMPGAERIGEIRNKIKETGAACVFAEPQFEPKLISVVVEGTTARTGVLDPLGSAIAKGPDQYAGSIRALAKSMADCLSAGS